MRIKKYWQRIAIILAALFALYVLSGFFAVPPILKSQLKKRLYALTNRPVTLGKVRFNPFVLSLTLRDFRIEGKNGEDFVGWQELYINSQTSSLFRFSWTFDEIRWIKPGIYIERLTADEFNFSDLLNASNEPSGQPEKAGDKDAEIVPLSIGKLILDQGKFQFRDSSRGTPSDFHLASVSFELDAFSTRLKPGETNAYDLKARGPKGGSFHWNGTFQLTPIQSKGYIELGGIHLPSFVVFYQDDLQFAVSEGQFSFSTKYRLFDHPEWGIELKDGEYKLSRLMVLEKNSEKTLLALPLLNIKDVTLSTTEEKLFAGTSIIKGGEFNASLNDRGDSNIARAMDFSAFDTPEVNGGIPHQPLGESAPVSGDEAIESSPAGNWYWEVAKFNIDGFAVNFSDNSVDDPVNLAVTPLHVQVEEIAGDGHKPFNLSLSAKVNEQASIEISGNGTVQPVSLALDINSRNLPLLEFQPYVSRVANITMLDGSPHTAINVQLALNDKGDLSKLHVTGNASIDNLSIQDNNVESKLLKWQRLGVEDLTLDALAGKLNISRILLTEPFVKIQIHEDKTTNIQDLIVSAPPDEPGSAAQESNEEQFRVDVNEIVVEKGAVSFADLSLKPDFVTEIFQLNGRIVGASSVPGKTSEIKLNGKLDRYALVTIQGKSNLLVDPPYLDLTVLFKNVDLASFTPYSGTYAGYKIEKGQISLDVRYFLENNLLHGENKIVIHKLELGEKVKSEQAVNLPLRLAVALLKDKDGVIDLDLVVDGDVNDPEFSVAGIFWKVLKNLIMKAATSPFKLLAGLAGGSDDNLDTISFTPGSSNLNEQEQEKMMRLAKALDARPQLSVNVRGRVSYSSDLQSLKQQHLDQSLETLSGVDSVALAGGGEKAQDRWRDTLFDLYKETKCLANLMISRVFFEMYGKCMVADFIGFFGAFNVCMLFC